MIGLLSFYPLPDYIFCPFQLPCQLVQKPIPYVHALILCKKCLHSYIFLCYLHKIYTTVSDPVNIMEHIIKRNSKFGIALSLSHSGNMVFAHFFIQLHDVFFLPHQFFDIHIHIPEGAVPKDGPSAGITMATAMLSAVTGTKVHARVAMTGEITLRGRVLPIGGLKEKTLAARMAHMEKVLVPAGNQPDMAEISKEITKGLSIVYVKTMEDVIREAFV